jgi:hypothetical protein
LIIFASRRRRVFLPSSDRSGTTQYWGSNGHQLKGKSEVIVQAWRAIIAGSEELTISKFSEV